MPRLNAAQLPLRKARARSTSETAPQCGRIPQKSAGGSFPPDIVRRDAALQTYRTARRTIRRVSFKTLIGTSSAARTAISIPLRPRVRWRECDGRLGCGSGTGAAAPTAVGGRRFGGCSDPDGSGIGRNSGIFSLRVETLVADMPDAGRPTEAPDGPAQRRSRWTAQTCPRRTCSLLTAASREAAPAPINSWPPPALPGLPEASIPPAPGTDNPDPDLP